MKRKRTTGTIKITADEKGINYEQNIEGSIISTPTFFGHVFNQLLVGFYKALCEGVPEELAGSIIILFLRTAFNETIDELGIDMESAEKMVSDFDEYKKNFGMEV